MNFTRTTIPDVVLIEPKVHGDARGFFMETYRADAFENAGIRARFVQDNHSASKKGILRGLHYQISQAQGKLVRVAVGEIFDVAVDLRRTSPTFGDWVGEKLSAENHKELWIPVGFAHGFLVLSDFAEVIYKATEYYAPEWERTLSWNDPDIAIEWPLAPGELPIVSAKDSQGIRFLETDVFD